MKLWQDVSGNGQLNLTGGIFLFQGTAKTFSGAISVQSGARFLVGANFNSSSIAVNVESGGRLVGLNGTLGGAGSSVVVANGGVLSASNAETSGIFTVGGNLTLESGSLTNLRVNTETQYDRVSVSGLLSYGGELRFSLAEDLFQNSLETYSFDLFTGDLNTTGAFDLVSIYQEGVWVADLATTDDRVWSSESGQWLYSFDQDTGALQVAAVPEPGTIGLLVIALGAGVVLARRRNTAALSEVR